MQGMTRQEKATLQFISPTGFDEAQIKLLVGAIDFVADNRVAEVRQMDADLVGSPRARECADNGKLPAWSSSPNESLFHPKFGHG